MDLLLVGAGALVALIAVLALVHRARTRTESAMARIDRMDGAAFERYLVALFERLGFRVKHVGARNDFGADLLIERNGARIAVQAKARRDYVAISAVQQALGARFYYGCDGALVVTNRFFSKPASALARKADVELWNRDDLAAAIDAAEG